MDGQAKISLLLELKNKLKGGLDTARRVVSENVKGMQEKLEGLKIKHVEVFDTMKNKIPGFASALEVIGNPYVLITAGVTALTLAYGKASSMADEWSKGIAKVNVTAQLTGDQLKELDKNVLNVGKNSYTELEQVPEGFNRIISAGLDTNAALAALEPTLKAAKAGFTDLETVAAAGVGSMNASGMKDINQVYDVLFATLNKGNAEFKDIANYLPKIIPMAKQAGQTFQTAAGGFAYLTAQGLSAEQSATSLMNLFKSLSDEQVINGSGGKLGLKGLGIDIFDAAGKVKPFVEIIDQLKNKMESLDASHRIKFLDQIGLDMESSTALNVMIADMDKLKSSIDFTTNSGGQLQQAFENSKTPLDGMILIGNQIKAMFIEVGQKVNESFGGLINEILPYLTPAIQMLKDLFSGVWDIIGGIVKTVWAIAKPIFHIIGSIVDFINKTGILKTIFSVIGTIVEGIFKVLSWVGEKLTWLYDHTIGPIIDGVKWVIEKIGSIGSSSADLKVAQDAGDVAAFAAAAAKINQQAETIESKDLYKPGQKSADTALTNTLDRQGSKKGKEATGGSISGKAQQVRNITINVDTIGVNGDFISKSPDYQNMSKADFTKWMQEILTRYTASLETSYE